MTDDVTLNKSAIIRRCLARVDEEYGGDPANLHHITRQDSIILNIQRGWEAAIDLAMHVVSERRLGLPQSSRNAFDLLEGAGVIDEQQAGRLRAGVGFRNLAVHNYEDIDLDILQHIVEGYLVNLTDFANAVMRLS